MTDRPSQISPGGGKKSHPDPKRIKAIQAGAKKADEIYAKEMDLKNKEEIPKAEKDLENVLRRM